jgi:magnesium transporter
MAQSINEIMVTGLLNGLVTALTCSVALYFWSQSLGLAIVIALAMVSSLMIAGRLGAVVPYFAKKIWYGLCPIIINRVDYYH